MNSPLRSIFVVLFSFALAHSVVAAPPRVVAAVSPIHSLAAALLAGTDSAPALLIPGNASPHHFQLRPSGAALLENADLVFWVSEYLESPLAKPIAARARPGAAVQLLTALDEHDLLAYEKNEHRDDHDEHGHDEHDEHDHDEHDEHGHDEHDEHGHDEHDHGAYDPHVWLSPALAGDMAEVMAAALVRTDAANAELYRANLARLREMLTALDAELRAMLAGLPPLRAFAQHDAYGYFIRAYGLAAPAPILGAGAETHGGLSAARVAALREQAERENIRCVLTEPQLNRRMLTPIVRGFEMKVVALDPLGADLPPGPDAYFQTLRNLAKAFAECATA